jgi:two-component system LytT family response regulator
MFKVIIVDDEPLARSVVRSFLKSDDRFEVLAECNDGFEALKAIQAQKPDLLFLDVQMPRITGLELLELLEETPPVIFTTAFDEFAIQAFEANAVDYLLKPFGKERFDKAIQKYMARPEVLNAEQLGRLSTGTAEQQNRVVIKNGTQIKIIPIQQIAYLEAADDYVKLYTSEGSFLKNKTMAFFEQTLPADQFVRVHRSYLVRIAEIVRIDPYEKDGHLLLLKNGAKIPVSKTGFAQLKKVLRF